jgi:hypothetical protein
MHVNSRMVDYDFAVKHLVYSGRGEDGISPILQYVKDTCTFSKRALSWWQYLKSIWVEIWYKCSLYRVQMQKPTTPFFVFEKN